MNNRTLVKQLAALPDGPVTVAGWVETVRDQKKVQFVILRDESGAVQLVNPATRELDPTTADAEASADAFAITEEISALAHGSFISVTGELKHDERVKLGGLEVKIASLDVVAEANPETPDRRGLEPRQAHGLALPRPAQPEAEPHLPHPDHVPARAAHVLGRARLRRDPHARSSWRSASESRAELFEVGYFEGTAYLAQSPQFFKQMAQPAGFGKVFEVGPAFRADPSFTSRHATEFTSIDAEMSWVDSHEDVMRMHEELLVAGITAVKDEARRRDRRALRHRARGADAAVPAHPARRGEADRRRPRLRDPARPTRTWTPRASARSPPTSRRRTDTTSCSSPTTRRASGRSTTCATEGDPSLTNSYDLIYNGVEISTGAQREHRIDILVEQAKEKGLDPEELEFYLDFFRYGVPPHGGFGMGLARVLMLMLEEHSIRETTYLFRGPTRLLP